MIPLVLLLVLLAQFNAKICKQYTSASGLYNASRLKNQYPVPIDCGELASCEVYVWGNYDLKSKTSYATAYGWWGVFSAWGPLSSLGPGTEPRSQQYPQDFWQAISLSNQSPLSNQGPLGDKPYFDIMVNQINDFTKHMQGNGIWSTLGPIGPLGPLGILGPLGPNGIHGFKRLPDGDYINKKGQVQKTFSAEWENNIMHDWPLFETYSQDHAIKLGQKGTLDTSFSVQNADDQQTFQISAEGEQFVSILVVPIVQGTQFDIYVHENGSDFTETKIKSNALQFSNWVQLKLEKSSEFSVTIDGAGLYNFYVVGSTPFMNREASIQYDGDYITYI